MNTTNVVVMVRELDTSFPSIVILLLGMFITALPAILLSAASLWKVAKSEHVILGAHTVRLDALEADMKKLKADRPV